MSGSNKAPPLLSAAKSYEDWIKLLEIWRTFTSLGVDKMGPAVALSLQGEAQQAILELSIAQLSAPDGVDKIIERLNKIYGKDELVLKFNKLESFESYKRPPNLSMREFLTEFELRYHKVNKNTLSDDLIAYRLLKAANLQERDE